jgi:hypothetical protein
MPQWITSLWSRRCSRDKGKVIVDAGNGAVHAVGAEVEDDEHEEN